ncbi:hypothetical protein CMEL01_12298 [Colletotrichum melonis]|uniref:Uncharacterized protein n=1 Tax=Colletotrichum melonis TaxID=1209925 RepID=A0AAI9UZK4_9PEZI|nr:hypothetical protein CMEL01_12298 [Colletotrichum melonis]
MVARWFPPVIFFASFERESRASPRKSEMGDPTAVPRASSCLDHIATSHETPHHLSLTHPQKLLAPGSQNSLPPCVLRPMLPRTWEPGPGLAF